MCGSAEPLGEPPDPMGGSADAMGEAADAMGCSDAAGAIPPPPWCSDPVGSPADAMGGPAGSHTRTQTPPLRSIRFTSRRPTAPGLPTARPASGCVSTRPRGGLATASPQVSVVGSVPEEVEEGVGKGESTNMPVSPTTDGSEPMLRKKTW